MLDGILWRLKGKILGPVCRVYLRPKGCTHIVMILCDGAVDSHRKE